MAEVTGALGKLRDFVSSKNGNSRIEGGRHTPGSFRSNPNSTNDSGTNFWKFWSRVVCAFVRCGSYAVGCQ